MLFLKRFFVLCFLFIITNANAYLDPGTGSLLLSSVVAIFASAVYFLKNLFYKIISVRSFAYGKKMLIMLKILLCFTAKEQDIMLLLNLF